MRLAASRAACTAGRSNEIKIPMIVMTTKSSTKVKPFLIRRFMSSPEERLISLQDAEDIDFSIAVHGATVILIAAKDLAWK